MKELKFYRCRHCGNVVWKPFDTGVPVFCCGEEMELLAPNTVDAAVEKHIPVLTREGGKITVRVGSVRHPMEDKHFIGFIALVAEDNVIFKLLKPGEEPEMTAETSGQAIAYAWCNLHGLWKSEK